jgi:hypothetical protein
LAACRSLRAVRRDWTPGASARVRSIGRALLFLVLVAPVALTARWHGSAAGEGPRFQPRPDALEYAAAAQAVARTGRVYLQVGPLQVRSRYPPGWPLLLSLAVRAGVGGPSLWRVTGLFGAGIAVLLAVVVAEATLALEPTAGAGRRRIAPVVAGLLAGWIWALAPIAVGVGRTLLSDEPAALAVLAALVCTGVGFLLDEGRRATIVAAAGGLALGLAAGMRPITAVLLIPALVVVLLTGVRGSGFRPLVGRAIAWGFGAAVFPAVTMLVLYRSGLSPWEWSGYAFWIPARYGRLADTFSLRHALVPDESFRIGVAEPVSHLGVAARALLGLPGLRLREQFGLFWPILGWLAVVPLLVLVRRRGGRTAAQAPWLAAALALWVMGHVVVFSMYFYPSGRFYLAPLALCTALFATACGAWLARPGPWSRLGAVVVAVLVLASTLHDWRGLQSRRPPLRGAEWNGPGFERWKAQSDEERAGRTMPFDPVHAQALGLLTPEVASGVREWGGLPPTQHVRRLRDLGLLAP